MTKHIFIFFYYDNPRKDFSAKLQYYSCLLLSFSIPFNNILINIALGLLAIGWIMQGNYLVSIKEIFRSSLLSSITALFFLYLIGMLYSENISEGNFSIEKKLSFILFPLLIGANKSISFSIEYFKKMLLFFIAGCSIVSLLCFARGVYFFIFNHTSDELFYHELGSLFNLHAVYFSVYLACAAFFLLWLLERNFSEWNSIGKIICAGLILFFSGMIMLLSARTVMASYLFLFTCFVFYFFYKRRKIKFAVITAAFLLFSAIGAVWNIPFIHERFAEIANSKWYFSPEENNANGFTLRLVKWACSIQGIKENLFTGVGTGDAQDYLQECYKNRNFWGQVFQYNSHNQFLQTGLTIGITGMLALIYCLFIPLLRAFRKKELLLFVFLLLIILTSMTESFLERQQGIIFFCFFYSLLLRDDIYSSAGSKK